METTKSMPSSIFPNGEFDQIEGTQLILSPWVVVGVLLISFLILKKFIYTKDESKHGK